MAMLAQQMQLANAMMPGAPLQPVATAKPLSISGIVSRGSHPRKEGNADTDLGVHGILHINYVNTNGYINTGMRLHHDTWGAVAVTLLRRSKSN